MKLSNNDLREMAKAKNVRFWEIAEKMKISDPTMTRLLRKELPKEEKEKMILIINQIEKERSWSRRNHNEWFKLEKDCS